MAELKMDFTKIAEGFAKTAKEKGMFVGCWIPVSEDLPEDAYGCIVTVLDVDLRTLNEFENVLPYFVGYDGETWNNAGGEPIPYEVIAWMKAPEPYKADKEEKSKECCYNKDDECQLGYGKCSSISKCFTFE